VSADPSTRPAARLPQLLPESRFLRSDRQMDEGRLTAALDRAERAILRIEHAISQPNRSNGRDEELRARVREAVAELDQIIRMAESA
jgi:hypothetical protein